MAPSRIGTSKSRSALTCCNISQKMRRNIAEMAYVRILRTRGIALLVLATLAARLPVGINGLAVLLYVEAERGSFATAGIVAGALAFGTAIAGPLQGRVVDRRGLSPLLVTAACHAAGLAGLWALARIDSPTALLALVGLFAGISLPPATSVLRSRWAYLVGDEPRVLDAAYALDSVLIQVVFVAGPLLTAAAIASVGPEGALLLSAVCVVLGTATLTVLLLRHAGPQPRGGGARLGLGALASPPIRALVVASFPVGFYLGCVEVALPAYSEHVGRPALAGVFYGIFFAAGVVAGLLYGVRRSDTPVHVIHLRMTWLLPLAGLPLAFASSDLMLALLVAVAGAPLAPLVATRNQVVASVSDPGMITEAFAWPLTAMVAGISAGAAVAGSLAEAAGWSAPLLAGALLAGVGALFLRLHPERLTPVPVASG
jgi:predicted MFS family arabinose efflux permease